MRVSLFITFLALLSLNVTGQNLHFSYDFDECDFEDSNTNFPAIIPNGNPSCVCGLGENSMQLDGLNDYLEFDPTANALFSSNFTLDFYFWLDETDGIMDIMSLRTGCGKLDSMMQLRYYTGTNELDFEIGSSINNFFAFKSKLNKNNCWHRFSLVKFGLEYQAYLDNELMGKFLARENIIMTKSGRLFFRNNPCNSIDNAHRFKGKIDEIQLHSVALSDLELIKTFKYPDRIITSNATIFKGTSLQLETGVTCSQNISWTPSATLSDASIPDPIATPEQTTTYTVTIRENTCNESATLTPKLFRKLLQVNLLKVSEHANRPELE